MQLQGQGPTGEPGPGATGLAEGTGWRPWQQVGVASARCDARVWAAELAPPAVGVCSGFTRPMTLGRKVHVSDPCWAPGFAGRILRAKRHLAHGVSFQPEQAVGGLKVGQVWLRSAHGSRGPAPIHISWINPPHLPPFPEASWCPVEPVGGSQGEGRNGLGSWSHTSSSPGCLHLSPAGHLVCTHVHTCTRDTVAGKEKYLLRQ